MDTNQIRDAIDGLGSSWEEYKKVNDKRIAAIEAGKSTAEFEEKLGRIEADLETARNKRDEAIATIKQYGERIDELEAAAARPGALASKKTEVEYTRKFEQFIRSGGNDDMGRELKALERKHQELRAFEVFGRKDITIGTAAAGGYAVPEVIASQIEMLEKKISPVRNLVTVRNTSTSDYKELVSIGGATSGWVGETDTRSETATPQLRERTPTNGELYAYPEISEWAADDIFFDVGAWLTSEVADAFATAESTSVLTGDGSNQLTGIFNTTPVSTADWASPLRAAAAIQYVPMDAESPVAVNGDDLIDTVYTLNRRYRAGASWAMNSLTTGVVRKLKDSNGYYHWQPGLQAGEPDRLLGYPHFTWEEMADVSANSLSILFGNFRRAYIIANRVGMRITRETVTHPGYHRFYIRRREGGCVLNNDALKVLRTSAS